MEGLRGRLNNLSLDAPSGEVIVLLSSLTEDSHCIGFDDASWQCHATFQFVVCPERQNARIDLQLIGECE